MAVWQEPSWLQNYVAEQKANAGSFGERYLKPFEQAAVAGITAYKSGEKSAKVKEIINTETNAAKSDDRPINYDKIYKLLIPIDKDEAAKYADLAAEYNKSEVNKTVAAAFKKPREEYELTKKEIESWDSTATTLKGLQAELETAQSELEKLENSLNVTKNAEEQFAATTKNIIRAEPSRQVNPNQSSIPLQSYIAE